MTVLYFNVSPGARHGKIEKEGSDLLKGMNVQITVDEARELWEAGEVEDSNIAFWRLASGFDFDVEACLEFYRRSGVPTR